MHNQFPPTNHPAEKTLPFYQLDGGTIEEDAVISLTYSVQQQPEQKPR